MVSSWRNPQPERFEAIQMHVACFIVIAAMIAGEIAWFREVDPPKSALWLLAYMAGTLVMVCLGVIALVLIVLQLLVLRKDIALLLKRS